MNENTMASKIINCVFEEADYTIDTLAAVKSKEEIASVYTALIAYFLATYEGEADIAGKLSDVFQSKIRRRRSEEELSGYSEIFSDAYVRFSERGVAHKLMTAVYEEDYQCYVDIVTDMIGVHSNGNGDSDVLSIIYELHTIASRAGRGEEPRPRKKPTVGIAIVELLLLIGLYFLIWGVYETIGPTIHEIWIAMTEKLVVLNEFIYSFCMPFLLVLCISLAYSRIVRNYYLSRFSGTMFLIVNLVHAFYEFRKEYMIIHDFTPKSISLFIFFPILFLRLIQFVKPRIENDIP